MFVTIVVIDILKNFATKFNAIDIPNWRKVHENPIPTIGGLGMAAGALVPILLWTPIHKPIYTSMIIGTSILIFVGLFDDIFNFGYKIKLFAQIIAALVVILIGDIRVTNLGIFNPYNFLIPDWLTIVLSVIVIVGITNAINLSDGLDGLAAGIAFLSFICIGYLSYLLKIQPFIVITAAMSGSIFGFLRYNTYPAIVFMGDSGSQLLGFILATLSLTITQKIESLSPFLIVLIIGIPIIDTFIVIVQRIISGRSPFFADKNHFHHRLLDLGLYHSESVIVIYIIHAFLVCLAFIFRFYPDWLILTIYLVLFFIILTSVTIAAKAGWKCKRSYFLDKIIKGRLKEYSKGNFIIKFSFKMVKIGFYVLFLFTCFLPAKIPTNLSLIASAYLISVFVIWKYKREWVNNSIGIGFYLFIPFLIYLSETDMVLWMNHHFFYKPYNLFFGILTFFSILTLKFTRRRYGFKFNPTDLLILFVALAVPNVPDENIKKYHMGLVAVKIIVFYFTYEIIVGELRIDMKWFRFMIISAYVIIGLRGFIG
jgi:UDP-GlcNAc:undecaprenyl-phosphate GlcNAc-1-phosphate transferase